MEALREENALLKRNIETNKVVGAIEEESEYHPTGHTTGGIYSSYAFRKNRKHPFIDGNTETPRTNKWKAFTITYDGTTDPNEFIFIYTNYKTREKINN